MPVPTPLTTLTSKSPALLLPKGQMVIHFKRILAAFLEAYDKFEEDYGVVFVPLDECIPDAHKYYYMLQGMLACIQDKILVEEICKEFAITPSLFLRE